MDPESLRTVELLAVYVRQETAESLLRCYGSLNALACASIDELTAFPGIGKARALAILAAFTLAARLRREILDEQPLLDSPERIADLLREENRLYQVEHFQLILLNTRRRLIRILDISKGSLDSTVVHPREVFCPAIHSRASAVVLVHNHPSGDPTPSTADIKITRELVRAGQLLKINVLDHIILGKRTSERTRDFVSLREQGYFYQ